MKSSDSGIVKTPLVLIPGLLCDATLWAGQIAGLADVADCWVADVTRDDSMPAMAQRVLDEAPFTRFALAGLSMGGYVAQAVMRVAADRVDRLALLDTGPGADTPERTAEREDLMDLARRAKGFTPINRVMLPMLVHASRLEDEPLLRAVRDMAERVGVEAYIRQQRAIIGRPDGRADLRQIACPTLVLCGREDALTSLALHEEMAALVPGARLEVIEQCGHMTTMERPEAVNAALRLWLSA